MYRYKIFLEKLSLINEKYKILNSCKDNFNIFSILGNEFDEVNLHSKFISELFKNKSYGYIFLNLFLKNLELENISIKEFKVFTEYSIKYSGRIDILIKLIDNQNKKKAIIIENKIYADDQNEQLNRYYNSLLSENYQSDEIEMVYLTLYGHEPSEISTKNLPENVKVKIKTISYRENIIEWIEYCIKEAAESPIIRETLIQYNFLLKKITNKEEKSLNEELKNLILSNNEYLDISFNIPDILIEVKKELQLKYWRKLEEKLTLELAKYNIILEKNINSENKDYSEKFIEEYYTKSKNNKYYGLMYFIKSLDNGDKLYLRIEVNWYVYYGFRIIDSKGNSNRNMMTNFLEKELEDLDFQRTEYWLGWKHLEFVEGLDEIIGFREFPKKLAQVLNDDNKLEKLIDDNVKEIEKTWLYLKDKI